MVGTLQHRPGGESDKWGSIVTLGIALFPLITKHDWTCILEHWASPVSCSSSQPLYHAALAVGPHHWASPYFQPLCSSVYYYVLHDRLLQKFASFNASAPSGQSSSALRFSLFLIPDSGTLAACLNALAPAVKCLRIILKRRNLYSNLIIVQISLAWQHSLSYLSSHVQRRPLETRVNAFDSITFNHQF